MNKLISLGAMLIMLAPASALAQDKSHVQALSYGERPFYLIDKLEAGELKDKLMSCAAQMPQQTAFSVGHRGAPLQFPEHTVQSNVAAARQGAGVLECDVTFTADKELVCRHAQNDLHTTTNIVATDLGAKCTTPFAAAAGDTNAAAECRTSDLTLAEFRTLKPKMDASFAKASTAQEYLGGTAGFRTDLFVDGAELMTHKESIELFKGLGAKFTPELKSASVEMPYDGFTQGDYAQKLIDEYKAAGIPASDVFPQSFNYQDVLYWIDNEPEFGKQAVYLIDDSSIPNLNGNDPATWGFTAADLKARGVNYVAPAIPFLLTLDGDKIVPSRLTTELRAAGINIITWSLERSGPLATGGGWYYNSVTDAIDSDADYYNVLHALAQDVGIKGIFSDWPATVTYYANCYDL